MLVKADTVAQYLEQVDEPRKEAFNELRNVVKKNIPKGFEEVMNYGMIGYVVPHKLFPAGYHCDPKLPLPFINLAIQKNFIALYHMGIYAQPELLKWFESEYPKHCQSKLDMGKSCIRFKKVTDIPFKLIEALVKKMSAQEWIALYQANLMNANKKK